MKDKEAGPITSFIIGLIFCTVGSGLTYFKTWPDFQLARESTQWPKTMGTIERSEVITRVGSDNKTMFMPMITYSYTVGSQNYKSSQIYMGSSGVSESSSSNAYSYTSKFPAGKQVQVYYLASQPGEALLEPGLNMLNYILLGATCLFSFVGLMVVTSSIFKLAIVTTMAAVFLGDLFKKRKTEKRPSPSGPTRVKRTSTVTSDDINLDDEMKDLNKVASSNNPVADEPWNHKWIVKTSKKEYGPYTYEEIMAFYEQGKLKEQHECYAEGTQTVVKISSLIRKKAA